MIVGVGVDLCEIDRIADAIDRRGQSFLNRVFTPNEQTAAQQLEYRALFYASRFAAKEACLKALGTGITTRVRLVDIEIADSPAAGLVVSLSGGALTRMRRLAGGLRTTVVHVSVSYEKELVCGFVVIEAC